MENMTLLGTRLVVDYFAGGGGASKGIELATGRSPNVAVNHCAHAISMHELNHPTTVHLLTDVWDVDPVADIEAGPIGLAWFSPDCAHFSRAKGKKPLKKKIRGLAWVVLRVAAKRRPSVLMLENVSEFQGWGPLGRKGHPLKPKKGQTFARFKQQLTDLGYRVEHQILNAADYGAPTIRKRLFLIARCDGLPIVWPEPTHGPGRARPYRTAAECIDWTLPSRSIFGRKRPLAENTMRRIAVGLKKHVLNAAKPFIVQVNHGRDVDRSRGIDAPLPTITAKHGYALVTPTLIQTGYGERKGQRPRSLDLHEPLGTIVACGAKHALVTTFLTKFYGTSVGASAEDPTPTVTGQGQHIAAVACHLTKQGRGQEGQPTGAPRFDLVQAFLSRHLGEGDHTTVTIDGELYRIADICLRMLSPRELARAQGFPDTYVLVGTNERQVERIGNSVPPQLVEALVRANATYVAPPLARRPRRWAEAA